MSLQIYTNCSTLTVGCNLYTNSAKTIQAANGFYSDGTFCYTVLNGAITNIASCTSTTTSTTTTSTTTIVVNPCRCYEVVFGSGGGEINYNDCDGNTFNYVSLGASTYYQCVQVIGGLAQIFVISGAVTLNIVGNCLTGPCPPTTTTTTTVCPCKTGIQISVSVTGAEPSVNWTDCYGNSGGGYYPNGDYTLTDCIQPTTLIGTDCIVTITNSGTCCTTTTTTSTSTTTTTTAAPTYDYYNADYYDCTNCGAGPTGTMLVSFAAGSTVVLNRFYQPVGGPDGFAYKVTGAASSGIAYILTTSFGSTTTCALACTV
jgi:hypothetical protein